MGTKPSDEAEQVKDMIKSSQKLRKDSMRLAKTQRELTDRLKQLVVELKNTQKWMRG